MAPRLMGTCSTEAQKVCTIRRPLPYVPASSPMRALNRGPYPVRMLGRHLGLSPAPTVCTPALMQYPVGHVHRDRRQLKHLMRMVRRRQGKRRVATRTPLGPQFLDRRGRQEHLAMAWMARFSPRFAGCGSRRTLPRLLVGRVRRRRPMRGRGVLCEPRLQGFDALLELAQCIASGCYPMIAHDTTGAVAL